MPITILREHYRCHPRIIEFYNQEYYDGELLPYTDVSMSKNSLVLYKTSAGNHMRKITCGNDKVTYNQHELDVIVSEIIDAPDLTERRNENSYAISKTGR